MAGKKNNGFVNVIAPEKLDEAGNYVLDEIEKSKILEGWNVAKISDLKQLIFYTWSVEELDGRAKQGIALKKFLASRNASPIPAQVYIKQTDITELGDEDKEFIKNHAIELNPLAIAKLRWPDMEGLGDLRYRLTQTYYDSLPPECWNPKYAQATKDYTPPKTTVQAIARLRGYKICYWEEGKMSQFEKECLRKLIEFSNIPRFENDMSSIKNQKERDLVEAEFFRHIYDKPDLSSEDLSAYISACFTTLDIKRLREEEENARRMITEAVDDDGKPVFNHNLVEYAASIRTEVSSRQTRLETTFKNLNGGRAERMKNKGAQNVTLASLVEVWKDKTKRDKVNALAKKREERLKEEMAELESMDALKFEMWGANPIELLH